MHRPSKTDYTTVREKMQVINLTRGDYMSKPTTEVKRRYNSKVYSVVSYSLPKQLVADFKAKCKAEGISQASIIRSAIENYLNS